MLEGDIVEVCQFTFDGTFKQEHWRGAVVLAVRGDKFLARLLAGTFDGEHNEKWFSFREAGNQWR